MCIRDRYAPTYNFELDEDELLVRALKHGFVKKIGDDEYIKTKEESMSNYEKIEWIHSQLSELRDGVEVDLETMQHFVEDIREKFIIKEEA